MKFVKDYPVVVIILLALTLSNVYTAFAVNADKSDTGSTNQETTGAKGESGTDGTQGAKGETGTTGAKGVTGATGAQGLNGSTGADGQNGLRGIVGPIGPRGPAGLSSIALLHGSVTTATPSNIDTTIPFDAVNGEYGTFQQIVTSPTTGYNPGDEVAQFNFWSVSHVDTRVHAYNVGITIVVCDTNRNRCLTLIGWAHANNSVSSDTATLTPQDLSVQSSIGSGLSYDDSTGVITSSDGFGGEYSVVIDYVGTLS